MTAARAAAELVREHVAAGDDRVVTGHIAESMMASPRWLVGDLYGPLAAARAVSPVQQASQWELTGFGEHQHTLPIFADSPIFSAIGYRAVQRAFSDAPTFSSSIHNLTIGQVWGETLLGFDDPEHRVHRELIAQAFTKGALARWETEVVVPVVDGLLDRFVRDGEAELTQQLTMLFPIYVIAELLGLPVEDRTQFTAWAVETIMIFHDPARALAASAALGSYVDAIVEQRRVEPGDDLISSLVGAELDGRRLTNLEIVSFVRLLLPAGAETTYRSTSNLLFGLLTHPEQLAALRADRSLLPAAIEEGLRWEAPLTSVNRITTVETELEGVTIPAGAIVECGIGGANHDPDRWSEPERFDIGRPSRPHLAFAAGPHTCLGLHLARLETRTAITALLDRTADLALDLAAPGPDVEIRGIGFRAPSRLPVRFRPVAR